MSRKLFVAFVKAINRLEEREGISSVKHNRDPKLASFVEDGIEALIINTKDTSVASRT